MSEREGSNVSRLEGFSDAVFGFALTLLVVRLETPRTSAELMELVRGTMPFAVMFAMVCWIWWEHHTYFRHYGVLNAWTAFLNSVLLFVVVFYVYPLKFLTMALLGPLFGAPDIPSGTGGRLVLLIYGAGVVLVFGCFVLLYRHAARTGSVWRKSPADDLMFGYRQTKHAISMGIGALSVAIAAVSPEGVVTGIAGFVYVLMGPLHTWNGFRLGLALRRLGEE
jgi:hypothetical protein